MPKVLITDKLADEAIERLRARGLEIDLQLGKSPAELTALVPGCAGWIVRSGTQVEAAQLEAADGLKVVGRAGVGIDNIDVDAATRRGVAVVNTPTGNTLAAVEHSLALLLSLCRHVPQAHASVIGGGWERSKFVGTELYGKTMAVLGLGKIGSRVASRCRGFEMKVLGYDPFLPAERAEALGVELVADLPEIYRRADFVTLHLPNTPETERMIDAAALAQFKPGARLVNCARGALIDEAALAEALKSGHIGGAALDVFAAEPLPADSPLREAPNVVFTPHLGASTVESQRNVGLQVADRVADAILDGVFRDAVNIPVRDWATMAKLEPQLRLVERLGLLAQQVTGGAVSRVDVTYCGGPWEELPALNSALLKGVLTPSAGASVNTVNAPLLASERGIKLSQSTSEDSGDYLSMVELTLTDAEGAERRFAGTVFGDGVARVLVIDGFPVEAVLIGVMLLFVNVDRPGVIGRLGALLGQHDVNIASFNLGRTSAGADAIGILRLDSPCDEALVAQLAALEEMSWVKQINLPE